MRVARQGSEGGAQPFQREDSAQQAGSSLSCQTLDLKTQGANSEISQCKQSWSDMFNPWGGLLVIGTYHHPMEADPNVPAAAFMEYAADTLWVASHLTQLVGVALMVVALLLFADTLEPRGGSKVAKIAAAGAITSLALAAALQAVDGIALKAMVDAWAAAPELQKDGIFPAVFAVRQLEIGLASMFSLSMGFTATMFGIALIAEPAYPKWFGGLAIIGGLPTGGAGIAIAYTGFSGLSMAINMPANILLLIWMLVLGGFMWKAETAPRFKT